MSNTKSNELYHALHRLNRQMHRISHREGHGKGGLYHGQANLLLIILQNDGASQRDLAEQLDVRPSSMTEMLSRLEQCGLIVRKQDEKDQRVMHIYLTEEGKKTAEKTAESKGAYVESIFRALTEEEQEQMLILTEKLCAGLEADEDFQTDEMRHEGHHHGPCGENGMHHGQHCHGGHHGGYYHHGSFLRE